MVATPPTLLVYFIFWGARAKDRTRAALQQHDALPVGYVATLVGYVATLVGYIATLNEIMKLVQV